MAIPNTQVIRFTPRGVVDAFDATDKFPGACRQLTNLVFDESQPELVISRPGVTLLVDFNAGSDFGMTAGYISIQVVIGRRIYGMVFSERLAFYGLQDEPFCYDLETGTFLPISNVTAKNTPIAPPPAGPWTPPTLAVVGNMVLVTHQGFHNRPKYLWGSGAQGGNDTLWRNGAGATGFWGSRAQGGSEDYWGASAILWGDAPLWGDRYAFGVFYVDPDNPRLRWDATTTFPNTLTGEPTVVVNFSNRAYFAVKNLIEYTDVLTIRRNRASQQVTVGDTDDIIAMSGLPVQTTGSGMLQTMSIFKRHQTWQLGGDEATWNMSLSYTSLNIGTGSGRTLVQSPYGLYFISDAGPYFLDLLGTLRAVTHSMNELEPDVVAPMANPIVPTRWCGGYNSGIYRLCGFGNFFGATIAVDYWFDEHRRRWNGPHTFHYDSVSPLDEGFVLSSRFIPGKLVLSETQQRTEFTTTDLGGRVDCTMLSATFPKVDWMTTKQVVESQIELASTNGTNVYYIYAQNDQGDNLGVVGLSVQGDGAVWGMARWGEGLVYGQSRLWGGGALWGPLALQWGAGALWGAIASTWNDVAGSGLRWGSGTQNIPATYPIPWLQPLVFEKMQLRIDVQSNAEVGIGTFYAKYQKTGYMTFGIRR